MHLAIRTSAGKSKEMKLGNGYRVNPSSGLRAELGHILGMEAMAA